MIKGFGEIDNNTINDVCNFFDNNNDFDLLLKNYSYLEYNVLFSILFSTGKYNKVIYDYLYQSYINDKKILIISDTHYGSIYENINYIDLVFNFAINNNIHTILHGGDIIESDVNCHCRKGYTNIIKQANYFINKYPFDNSIVTYAIYGNHDYSAINENENVKNILSSRNDINILGFKKVFFNWCGTTISLQHNIENFKLMLPSHLECISFKGHSHFYHTREEKNGKGEKIYIPAMCNDPIPYISSSLYLEANDMNAKPGFLLAEIYDENIIITNYSFSSKIITKENEFVKVLKI